MCLVLIALDSHPDYSLIVAANRDEFYDRPTASAAFWADAPRCWPDATSKPGEPGWASIGACGLQRSPTIASAGGAHRPALARTPGQRLLDDGYWRASTSTCCHGPVSAAKWERLLSSAFIASSDYGTRSSTVVLLGRDGGVVFAERTFGSGGAAADQVRFEFQRGEIPRGRRSDRTKPTSSSFAAPHAHSPPHTPDPAARSA